MQGSRHYKFYLSPQTKTGTVRKVKRIRVPTLGVPSPHFGMSSRKSFQNRENGETVAGLGSLVFPQGASQRSRQHGSAASLRESEAEAGEPPLTAAVAGVCRWMTQRTSGLAA